MELFDTHCHLDDEAFTEDLPEVIRAAERAGVRQMLTQGTTLKSSRTCIRLAETYASVFAAVAIHPNCILEDFPDPEAGMGAFLPQFLPLTEHPRVRAIGETGLDEHWDDTPLEVQKAYLKLHLALARQSGLPVILHCREAESALLEVLRDDFQHQGPVPGIVHSFSGDTVFLRACLELGLHISYSGSVTFTNKKLARLRETVPQVPADKILVETDSPYLTPMPFRGKISRNSPEQVIHTAAFLAQLRGEDSEIFARQTTQNAEALFGCSASSEKV